MMIGVAEQAATRIGRVLWADFVGRFRQVVRDGVCVMGIVAFCPNGHRVKVKDALAGRKGVCPDCHSRFRIPLESCTIPTARVLSLDADWAETLPRAVILPADYVFSKGVFSKGALSKDAFSQGAREPERARGQERRDVDRPHEPALHPAIAEKPGAEWRVAIPGGEPSTPLTGSDMQAWLAAGRATGGEVVWRSEWPDWVSIRLVFPEFVPNA
jgi:hypothetical protein